MNTELTSPEAPVQRLDRAVLKAWPLPTLEEQCDKESRGHVLIVGGSDETPGAVILAAEAALRAGAGKLVVGTPHDIAAAVAIAVPEARVIALRGTEVANVHCDATHLASQCGDIDAMLIGPGMRGEAAVIDFTQTLMRALPSVPTVLDAFAMGAVVDGGSSREGSTSTSTFVREISVTPHAGEMAHLTGRDKMAILREGLSESSEAALAWGVTVVLKGATTFIATPNQEIRQHDGGHPGLATSGSGDVLAGLIAGFAARGAPMLQACSYGVVVHACAAAQLVERVGPIGFLAREVSREVPGLLHELELATSGA